MENPCTEFMKNNTDAGEDSMSETSCSFSVANNKSPTHKMTVAQVEEGVEDLVFLVPCAL